MYATTFPDMEHGGNGFFYILPEDITYVLLFQTVQLSAK